MCCKLLKFVWMVALLVTIKPQGGNSQFFPWHNAPATGSQSAARSTASQRQLGLGALGLSQGVVHSQSVSESDGGQLNGGTTSIGESSARSGDINLGGLEVGSTLTNSQTDTNGAVSRSLAHDLNVGGLGVGTSLSEDNLNKGIGLQHGQNGGAQLGLGFLNLDLSQNEQKQKAQVQTQAKAEAEGADAFAMSNSKSETESTQFGWLGLTNTRSESDAISGTSDGQSSASASGTTGSAVPAQRSKRNPQFVPFAYQLREFNRARWPAFGFQRPNFGYPQRQNANAQSLANNRNQYFEQQAGANTQSNQEINENGLFQNNGASSIGSNLALDGSSGQLSAANVHQDNSLTEYGSQSANNAQSQALNFDQFQQQAVNANAGTRDVQTAEGERHESHGGSQVTNNNPFGTSNNIVNTNSVVYEDGETRGSQADSSSQSIFQGNSGQNSLAAANSDVNSIRGPNGFVSNTAKSNASAVSRGGGQAANAVASASSYSDAYGGGDGGGNALANAIGNAGDIGEYENFDGTQANSGSFSNFAGAQGFANGQSGLRAFKIAKGKSYPYHQQPVRQQQNQTSPTILQKINASTIMNCSKNSIQPFTNNYYKQKQQQQEQQKQQKQQPSQPQPQQNQPKQLQRKQQPQQKYTQKQLHYATINPNSSSTEQFAVIDENQQHGRTFSFITDFFNSLTRPSCIYPCTLESYQQGRCCENFLVSPQPPPSSQTAQPPLAILRPPMMMPPPPPPPPPSPPLSPLPQPLPPLSPLSALSPPAFPLLPMQPMQCCNSCPSYRYYGPIPCMFPPYGGGVMLNMG